MKTEDTTSHAQPGGLGFTIRKLVREVSRASLATTLAEESRPYVSLVTVATDIDGSPLLLLSRLADHTRNIDADPHVSLLFDGTDGYANPQQGPRVSLVGKISFCNEARTRRRFLARHPGASLYADFADFAFYRVSFDRAHFVGGFGRAVWADDRLACDYDTSEDFAAAEPALLEEINTHYAEDITLLANKLLKRHGRGWQVVAVDPDGCDLALDKSVHRLAFDAPLAASVGVGPALDELLERARRNS